MIVYDLQCASSAHRFEGWFKSSGDFEIQQARGLISCPHCECADVGKAVQAPRLARKANQMPTEAGNAPPRAMPMPVPGVTPGGKVPKPITVEPAALQAPPSHEQISAVLTQLATLQAEALKSSRHVGKHFAKEARAMHYGEQDAEAIHGEASLEDARALAEEGIDLAPLLFPLTPEKTN